MAGIHISPFSTLIRDEGAGQGNASIMDFVGAGVTATVSNNVATITIPNTAASIPLSDVTAMIADATIDNLAFTERMNWDTLANTIGFWLSSTSTTASGNGQVLAALTLNGVNANASQVTRALSVTNSHTGTSSTNIAFEVSASGGTVNNALNIAAGAIALNGSVGTSGQVITSSAGGLNTWSTPSGTGVLSLSAIGATPNANAATITGTVLNLEPASPLFGGVVTVGAQTFTGAKNFIGNMGVNTIAPFGAFQASYPQYSTGTASQALTTITGVGTTFTILMVGSNFVFADGTRRRITGFTSTTLLTTAESGTVSSQAYNINYPGISVDIKGNVVIGDTENPANNSRLYVYGGLSGANIDVRGYAQDFKDISCIELEGSDYDSLAKSVALRYYGVANVTGTQLGYAKTNLGELVWSEPDTALIHVLGNTTPIRFGINGVEMMNLNSTSLDLGKSVTTKGVLGLYGNTSGKVTIQPAAIAGTTTLTLPTAYAAVTGYVLSSTDAGVLSWIAPASGMVYPGAGIALSTGSAWGTSITDNSGNWNTAYTDRLKWDGGATGLVAATGRTSLGGTTIGQNIFISTNPSAITFGRANADNTFDWLSAANFRTAIGAGTGSGTVTSVGFTGGLISVATATTTPALTVAGTSGGIPYFSSASTWASSALLAANALMIGGGAGATPATTTTGTGVLTALGVNTGSAGAFVVNGGALGTPSSGTLTNATGLPEAGLSLTDITTNNATTARHGLLLKLNNSAVQFMNGQGAWATPAGTFALTSGSGTTANGTAVDWTGTLNTDATIGGTDSFSILFNALLGFGAGGGAYTGAGRTFIGFDAATSSGWLGDFGAQSSSTYVKVDDTLENTQIILNNPTGGVYINDVTLISASNGYVWTLIDDTTGEGGWAVAAGGGVTSVTGTLNRITSTGGTTPVIDIAATYVGQSSITTLGTITTGVWTGTDIAVADGGTGRSTSTTAYGLIAAGTTATGVHQTLAAGATTEILVGGGGAALPVWTTATGTGAPVRTGTPTIATPSFTTGFTIGGAAASGIFPRGNGTNYVASTLVLPNAITANQVVYGSATNTYGSSANLTFNGTTLTALNDAVINSLTIGRGGGAIATNVAFGTNALVANTTGDYNTAIGTNALLTNTIGGYNVAIGAEALKVNLSGFNNVAIGFAALFTSSATNNNVAIGASSAYLTTGAENVAIGTRALYTNGAGVDITAVGYQALYLSTGSDGTAIGAHSLYSTTGVQNTGIGTYVGYDVTSGRNNTIVGYNTGRGITTGSYNTIIGASVTGLSSSLSNNIIIADGAGTIKAQYDATNWTFQGKIIATNTVRLKGYTVATLPAGTVGDTAYVTDALAPAFLVAVAGGGAVVTTVFYNGAAWVAQ